MWWRNGQQSVWYRLRSYETLFFAGADNLSCPAVSPIAI
jgi:hypothetical protein